MKDSKQGRSNSKPESPRTGGPSQITLDGIYRISKKDETRIQPNGVSDSALAVFDEKPLTRKPLEQALVAEHLFRRTIEDSLPCGVTGIDLNGVQIYVNRFFCDMVGWDREALLGTTFPFAYWQSEISGRYKRRFDRIRNAGVPAEGLELPFRRKNGESFWGFVTVSRLANTQGKNIGRLMSVVDISERKAAEQKLKILSKRLIHAQEAERKHVSRDLHDSIGGNLTGIKYVLESLLSEPAPASETLPSYLNRLIGMVQKTLEETQRISKNLHPSILDDLGVLAAIREFMRQFETIYAIRLSTEIRIEEADIPKLLKILIYRIVQEALTNVAKHSQAGKARVALCKSESGIELEIQDWGRGFDLSAQSTLGESSQGMGIESMKERAELFSGNFNLSTTPGKGALIHVIWPLD